VATVRVDGVPLSDGEEVVLRVLAVGVPAWPTVRDGRDTLTVFVVEAVQLPVPVRPEDNEGREAVSVSDRVRDSVPAFSRDGGKRDALSETVRDNVWLSDRVGDDVPACPRERVGPETV